MKEINVNDLISSSYPTFYSQIPSPLRSVFIKVLERILHIREINNFIGKNENTFDINFIDEIFEMLNFSFTISNKDIKKIPSEGKLICVANHPIGSLDSLSLIKLLFEIRTDVQIIANDILLNIDNIKKLLLPFKLDSKSIQRDNINSIKNALEDDKAIIIFPAAEVSRLSLLKVMDGKWHKGAVHFAKKFDAPILPIFIDAKNSIAFYIASIIHKEFSKVFLAHELFNKKNKNILIKVGDPIPSKAFTQGFINDKTHSKLLKKHVYLIGVNKKGIYNTEKNIIHPVDRKLIKKEVNNSQMLGTTKDNKQILLTTHDESPYILKEIARLREVTFRKVGEGTGKKLDLDKFDKYYKQLVVWDESELEIVGSYRLGVGNEIKNHFGTVGFYTSTLFNYSSTFEEEIMPNSVELGRSFVQKKYWNSQALHYLWQGIGAFLANNSSVKYLFGGVSISNSYPESTKNLMVYYFNKWFGCEKQLAISKNKFSIPNKFTKKYADQFNGDNYKQDYLILKNLMRHYGLTIPVLYKHYSELCENNGVKFLDFSVDKDFENCVDGLILVNVDQIKEEKKERYINCYINKEVEIN